jgi:type I restriction enzyme S subunit
VGKVHVVSTDQPFAVLSSLAILRPDKSKLDPRYFGHVLRFPEVLNDAVKRKTGSAIRRIVLGDLKQVQIPLPPLPEQRRIAAILDKADDLRAKRRRALEQLNGLTQAIFLEMFGDPDANPRGWMVLGLGDAGEFRYGTSNKSASHGKPALRIPNVLHGAIDTQDLKLVPVDDAEFGRLRLSEGDLLFVRTNGNPDFVGRCAVFERERVANSGLPTDEFVFASYLIRLRLKTARLCPSFLREFMMTVRGRRALRARSKTSAGQFNINTEALSSIECPLPPIELQRQFEQRVRAVEHLAKTAEVATLQCAALFDSLQHRAFSGEL